MRFVSSNPKATLVIPTRNRRARLEKTLRQIGDTPGPDVEVVVLDNFSEVPFEKELPGVRVIRLSENLGTAARNTGVQSARSEAIVMLDDDSAPLEGTVEGIIEALRDPALGMAACLVTLPDGSLEEGGAPFVPIGCGVGMRRDDFLRLGGYPPVYGTYVEEYDLAFRMLASGLDVRFDPAWRVRHEPQARSDFNFMAEKLLANNIYLAWKFFPENEAQAFCDWAVFRYGFLARQKNALAGFDRARQSLEKMKRAGLRDRSPLPAQVLEKVIPRRFAKKMLPSVVDEAAPLAFFRAGKEILDLVLAAGESGYPVEAIFDEGLLAGAGKIGGVPVKPYRFAEAFSGKIIVGGLSCGFVENTFLLAQGLGLENVVSLGGL